MVAFVAPFGDLVEVAPYQIGRWDIRTSGRYPSVSDVLVELHHNEKEMSPAKNARSIGASPGRSNDRPRKSAPWLRPYCAVRWSLKNAAALAIAVRVSGVFGTDPWKTCGMPS